ncbi:redoxin domain-containing protein, partial [Chryseobacterium sp.]
MLKVGDKLPEFEGINQDGETVSSSKLIGKKLVVFFYPQASTPTCTVEACNLSDNYSKLEKE